MYLRSLGGRFVNNVLETWLYISIMLMVVLSNVPVVKWLLTRLL